MNFQEYLNAFPPLTRDHSATKEIQPADKTELLSYLEAYDIDNIEQHIMSGERIYVITRDGATLFILDVLCPTLKLRIVKDGDILVHMNNFTTYKNESIMPIVTKTKDIASMCNLHSVVAASRKYSLTPILMLKKLGLAPGNAHYTLKKFYNYQYNNSLASKLAIKSK